MRLIRSVRIAAGLLLLILGYLLIGGAVLSGCAKPPAPVPIPVPESLRAKCPRPDPASVATVSDVLAFSIRQDAAIGICEAKKEAAVAFIDANNELQKPKPVPFWRRLLPP